MTATETEKTTVETPVETPAPEAPEAKKTAAPKKAPAKAKAADAPTGPSGKEITAAIEKGLKTALGQLTKVEKQTYSRLMKNGEVVAYISTHKTHARVTIAFPVMTVADATEAVEFVKKSVALAKKAEKK